MVIGEWPTLTDIRNKRYFTSNDGQYLRLVLRKLGFDLKDIYYTTGLKCNVDGKAPGDRYTKNLSKEMECCNNVLQKEIAYYKPQIIIGLGNIPRGMVMKKKGGGYLSNRGQFFKIENSDAMFFVCLLPEYVTKNPKKRTTLVKDLEFVKRTIDSIKGGTNTANKYTVVQDKKILDKALDKLSRVDRFSYDIETTGLDEYTGEILGIGLSWEEHTGVYIPFRHRLTPSEESPLIPFWDKEVEESILEKFRSIFKRPDSIKIAHNMGFEHRYMLHKWGIDVSKVLTDDGGVFDTQIYAYARDPYTKEGERQISLETLCSSYPDLVGMKDIWNGIKKDDSHDLSLYHPLQKYGEYCCGDADGTFRIATGHLEEIETWKPAGRPFKTLFYHRIMPTMFFISEMQHNGVPVDEDYLERVTKEVFDREEALKQVMFNTEYESTPTKLVKLPGGFNFNSTPQMQKFCFDTMKFPMIKASKKKGEKGNKPKTSTDREVLDTWWHQYRIKFAYDLIKYREINKCRTNLLNQTATFLNPVTGCVHANFKMWGTETGRLSVSNPPMQALPASGEFSKLIKKIFIAENGWVVIGADYSQIELRLIAWLSQDPMLLKAYLENIDVHRLTGSLVFSTPFDLVQPWQRRIGKTCNFGLGYRGSAAVLVRELGNFLIPEPNMTEEEILAKRIPYDELYEYAEEYRRQFLKSYKGLEPWAEREVKFAREHGFAISAYGRVRNLPEINSSDPYLRNHAENGAVNHNPQSTASDYLLFRFQDIKRSCNDAGIEVRQSATVHDALYMRVREKYAEEACQIVRTVGVRRDEANITVPMVLEPAIGKNFAEAA